MPLIRAALKKKIQNVNFFQKGRGGLTPMFTFFKLIFENTINYVFLTRIPE